MSGILKFACSTLVVMPLLALAVPSRPGMLTGQSGGESFQFEQIGDEFVHWGVTESGHTIKGATDGNWYYAERTAEGQLIPGATMVGGTQPAPASSHGLRPDATWLHTEINRMRTLQLSPPPGTSANRDADVEGSWNVLVILIEYPDADHSVAPGNFDLMMNEENYHGTGSFRDYYLDQSYGRFEANSIVTGWYMAEHEHDWYGANQGYDRAQGLIVEAVQAADASVDFSQFDNSGDGSVDALLVVHQGPGAEEGNQSNIWSHRWALWGAGPLTLDGVSIWDYTIQPEIQGSSMANIGVYVHEFGHNLGLPDLYDTDYSSSGIGTWGVMAGGSWGGPNSGADIPVSFCAWSRMDLGWSTVTSTQTSLDNYGLCASFLCDEIIRLNLPGFNSQYFLVENRQRQGWDVGLAEPGLLIWHVDESMAGNTNDMHYKVDLEQADGLQDLNQGFGADSSDPFPGQSANVSFSSDSSPSSIPYGGDSSPVSVLNISAPADTMHADFFQFFQHQQLAFEGMEILWDDNSNNWLEPGEQAGIRLHLRNDSQAPLTNLLLEILDNSWITLVSEAVNTGLVESGESFDSGEAAIVIQVAEELSPGNYSFMLRSTDSEGWQEDIQATTAIGRADVLLINDDSSLSLAENNNSYFMDPLLALGRSVEYRNSPEAERLADLDQYELVLWYTGAASNPLNEVEQALLLQRIAGGANILLCGQKIAQSSGSDLLDALGVSAGANENNTPVLYPDPESTIFSEGEGVLVTGANGAFNQIFPTVVLELEGANGVLNWSNGSTAASARVHPSGSRLVYCAFSVEAIHGAGIFLSRQTVLDRLMGWIENATDVGVPLGIPESFDFSVYPNPFNPATQVRFGLNTRSDVSMSVYNLQGRRVRSLKLGRLESGLHSQVLDLSSESSGFYFISLEIEGAETQVKRALLLK